MTLPATRLYLIICDVLAEEAAQSLALLGLNEAEVAPFPACCRPGSVDWRALAPTLEALEAGPRLFLLGPCGAVGTPGALRQEAAGWVHRVEACAELFLGRDLARHYAAGGAALLAPGHLARWSIGRQALAAAGRVERLILLDTALDESAPARLREIAAGVGLPAETLPVGLGTLGNLLGRIVLEWRLEHERGRATAALSEAIRRSSDHAMALDLIGDLARAATEPEAIESILDLFTLLFVPGRLLYVPWVNGRAGTACSRPTSVAEEEALPERLACFRGDYAPTPSGSGFVLRLGYQEETLGFLEIDEVALPQHLEHYHNLALILGPVCGLTLANARSYERRREAEEQIRHQAYHDTLTGLPNRLLFYDRLTMALAHAERTCQRLGVLFVDLDRFKEVNDSLGHDVGDMLLQEVARRLLQTVRVADTVARLGGDEFLVLLPDVGRPEDAMGVAERIREALGEPFDRCGPVLHVTASIGLALFPDDGRDAEGLIKKADMAMYRVKMRGRDGCGL